MNLTSLQLGGSRLLTRDQLRNVLGGVVNPPDGCEDKCSSDSDCPKGYSCGEVTFPSGNSCYRCYQNQSV